MNYLKGYIVLENSMIYGEIFIDHGKIVAINELQEPIESPKVFIMPGFIDQHIHGAGGFDVMDGSHEALDTISKAIVKEGVTSFLPTTMTGSNEKIKEALDNIHENMFRVSGANIIGVHLEGPFLNCKYNGAQPVNHIKDIDVELVEKWNEHNVIKIITAAPELANFDKLLEYSLSNKIVLSIGHTGATYREAQNAVDLGVKNFTHAFNAMSGFNHRETGVVGAMLVNDDTYAELIPDGIHVCTSAVKLLYKAKGPNRIIIVTDAIRAKWLDDGISELGGQKVLNKEGAARLENGHLAGSVLKFNNGIKYINSL